ncbi:MAG: hypothetical protein LBQ75_03530, partial [Zoogloeaceae bacterium]|nr:hypothetical protein [Zoogloeaceae bacterium]
MQVAMLSPMALMTSLRRVLRLSLLKKLLIWAGAVFALLFAVVFIYAQFWLFPSLHEYLPKVEAAATKALGQPVSIGKLEARLGFMPFVLLKDVRIFSGRAEAPQEIAIQAASIEGLLAWRSFLFGQPIF